MPDPVTKSGSHDAAALSSEELDEVSGGFVADAEPGSELEPESGVEASKAVSHQLSAVC
jgi:hypothetical protein